MASWLMRSSPDRAARVLELLAENIVLCSWAKHFTSTVLLTIDELTAGGRSRNTPCRFMLRKTGIGTGLQMGHLATEKGG